MKTTVKNVTDTPQNFTFMGATGFEIARGPADFPLVKGVGTKRLGKGRFKTTDHKLKFEHS